MGEKLGQQTRADLTIDQTGFRPNALRVVLAVVSIGLAKALITAQAGIRVFDNNPTAGESGVVGYILLGAVLASRLFARAVGVWVQFIDALIATITHPAAAVWQALQQLGLLQELDIRLGTRHAVGNVNDLTSVFIDGGLTLDGVRLLFATVPSVALIGVLRALHLLLEGVDNHHQFWHGAQQFVQVPTPFATWIRQAHPIPSIGGQQWQDTLQEAAHTGLAQAEKVAQHVLRWILPQRNDAQQHLVAHRQLRLKATAHAALPIWPTQALHFCCHEQGPHILHQAIELRDAQSGHAQEDIAIAAQVYVLHHPVAHYRSAMLILNVI